VEEHRGAFSKDFTAENAEKKNRFRNPNLTTDYTDNTDKKIKE
jgi:hypothetical protein